MQKIELALERLIEIANLPKGQRETFRSGVNNLLKAAMQGMLVPNSTEKSFELPKGFSWPTETYSEAFQAGKVKDIVEFLEDKEGWFPLIEAGLVSRMMLRAKDRTAESAVANYLRGGKRELPPHLQIPTKSQAIDSLAASYQNYGDQPVRLVKAIQRRRYRERHP